MSSSGRHGDARDRLKVTGRAPQRGASQPPRDSQSLSVSNPDTPTPPHATVSVTHCSWPPVFVCTWVASPEPLLWKPTTGIQGKLRSGDPWLPCPLLCSRTDSRAGPIGMGICAAQIPELRAQSALSRLRGGRAWMRGRQGVPAASRGHPSLNEWKSWRKHLVVTEIQDNFYYPCSQVHSACIGGFLFPLQALHTHS